MTAQPSRIIVCGAGIAGISAAYHLTVVYGRQNVVLVEADNPLSLTSDKSTESYRNWWAGPDPTITEYMSHSIDLLEQIARSTDNRINLNRRGYLFASAESAKAEWLIDVARKAERHGAGAVRIHDTALDSYRPSPEKGYDFGLEGADIITDRSLIRRHFPYLNPETLVVAHARRAGWLSAQQLGMYMLECFRSKGGTTMRGRLDAIGTQNGALRTVEIETAGERRKLEASHLVIAVGPMLGAFAKKVGLELPIFAERHFKISLPDTLRIVPRSAPMMIWLDPQRLPFSQAERELLAEDDETRWLTETFPGGVHGRPDGEGSATTLLMLFNYDSTPADVVFPLPPIEHYPEIVLRGMSTMVPGMKAYFEKGARPYVDGGYYVKTAENRPLIGPTSIGGVFLSAAYSGFGIMASPAGGDLVARHVLGLELPSYAPAFALARYQDPDYQRMLANWGDGGQI